MTDSCACSDTPIACSLDGASQVDRVYEWRKLGRAGLLRSSVQPGRLTVRYRLSDDQQVTLRELVQAERACCGFARFELQGDDGEVTLVVTGPVGTEQFFGFLHAGS